jgi:hypothetical protein
MSTLKSKPRCGAGGPRTAHGKSKSSQNSRKHLIFIDRVLPEEENAAASLYDEIQTEFRLEGAMELRIGRDLVQNELQAGRVENFALQALKKARMLAHFDLDQYDRNHTARLPIPKEHESEAGYFTRLRPGFCAMFLTHLKGTIEQRGLRPDEDLEYLRLIYGNQRTDLAEIIVMHYHIFEENTPVDRAEESTKKQVDDDQARILEAIQREIDAQGIRRALAQVHELFDYAPDSVLPPSDVDGRIERYRTANMRKMERLLAVLETVRRLKKKA